MRLARGYSILLIIIGLGVLIALVISALYYTALKEQTKAVTTGRELEKQAQEAKDAIEAQDRARVLLEENIP